MMNCIRSIYLYLFSLIASLTDGICQIILVIAGKKILHYISDTTNLVIFFFSVFGDIIGLLLLLFYICVFLYFSIFRLYLLESFITWKNPKILYIHLYLCSFISIYSSIFVFVYLYIFVYICVCLFLYNYSSISAFVYSYIIIRV